MMLQSPPRLTAHRRLRALLERRAVLLWLLFLAACGIAIAHARFTADLSAFLPRSPDARQQVLVDQLRDGLPSRLILVAIVGGAPNDSAASAARATLSRELAAALRRDPQFVSVNNGEPVSNARDQQFIFDHRYLLSPAVAPARFSAAGLHAALGESLDLLASSAGLVEKALLPHDPTGEVAALVSQLDSGALPASSHGVWASRDGQRAVLVVQTASAGSDTDAQARAIAAVRHAFEAATRAQPNASDYRLLMTGPGVFSVQTRDAIRHDVERLSSMSLVLVVALLLTVYRSPLTLALGLLPVLSGIAAGLAAVSLAFGTVHGLTLGFGTTLIGEAVDYSIYLFVQSSPARAANVASAASTRVWIERYWPTIRLGVLTSICGFASMLFSGFPGLVQLGLYSLAGLTAAAVVTRFVLPSLGSHRRAVRDTSRAGAVLARALRFAPRLRWPFGALLVAAIAVLAVHRGNLWSHELAALSPVPAQSLALDTSLRADVGAPDVRFLVVVPGASEQAALEGAEKVSAQLQPLVDAGVLAGFESPARFLPSDAAQRARQASLPDADVLTARMRTAVANQTIDVKPDLFAPFIADVSRARAQPLLRRADLQGTSMALAVDALLSERDGHWNAMLSLRTPAQTDAQTDARATNVANAAQQPSLDAARIRAAVARAGVPGALFVDLKAEADRLYVNYLREDRRLALAGFVAIAALLLVALRSPQRVVRTLAPLVAAALVVSAGITLAGTPLTLLHLIGMLLIVAVGSNYALFFNKPAHAADGAPTIAPQTLVSLLIANLATVAGFGLLSLSHVPMLASFGLTVGPGAILALLFSAILAPPGVQTAVQKAARSGEAT
ncbi:MMPL family transporter [Paraburkholderia sp.]|uniref:MMPL family transporter n=1 Tax=Paraburkholderia sp. TaxID=1926495 RepID=UPI0025DC1635|nr:MMPL family transporter [Paraburkholderia sp.]